MDTVVDMAASALDDTVGTALSIDDLEQRLLACERLIGRLRVEQVDILRILQAADVATLDGSRSLKEWVTARLDLHPESASHLSRAHRTLDRHADLGPAVVEGDISLDRAVATGRLRDSGAGGEVIAASADHDVAGVWRLAARHRRIAPAEEADIVQRRHLRMRPDLHGLSGSGWFELPSVDYATVEQALLRRVDEMPVPPDGAAREGLGTRLADALVAVCQDSLDDELPDSDSVRKGATVFVDAATAAPTRGMAGGEIAGLRVGPSILEEILCIGTVSAVAVRDARPIASTNRTRAIPPAIRSFVLWRDGACTIDGCRSRYRLQPHHVVGFARGGSHDASNLVTLCWYHHHVVIHLRGYAIDPESPPQRRRLIPPQYGHT